MKLLNEKAYLKPLVHDIVKGDLDGTISFATTAARNFCSARC